MFEFDIKEYSEKTIDFIRNVCEKEKAKGVLIGVSGGVDSATSLILAVKALGAKHVFPVLLPYGSKHGESIKDAELVIGSLKIPASHTRVIDIKPFTDSIEKY